MKEIKEKVKVDSSGRKVKTKTQEKENLNTLGEVRKSVWRMPRHREAKKDAANGETPRGAVSRQ